MLEVYERVLANPERGPEIARCPAPTPRPRAARAGGLAGGIIGALTAGRARRPRQWTRPTRHFSPQDPRLQRSGSGPTVRILFANHTSAWSGAEVALMRLADELRREHEVGVACPPGGPLADAVDAAHPAPGAPEVDVSMRLHPVATPGGLGKIGAGGLALARAASRFRADVIHANTHARGTDGVRRGARRGAARRGPHPRPALLTPWGARSARCRAQRASEVMAVSDYTARMFNAGLEHPVATRVYNSIDHDRFDPGGSARADCATSSGSAPDALLLGQVAQITPWKGQDTSIRALAEVRGGGLDAHLLLVGGVAFTGKGVRYDNRALPPRARGLVDELGVRDAVHFLGQRDDVPEVMRALDLTLLPS